MTSELLQKAMEVTVAATASGALVPLNTSLTHLMGDGGSRFELRHLHSAETNPPEHRSAPLLNAVTTADVDGADWRRHQARC